LPNIGFIVIAGPLGTSSANAVLASSLGLGIFIEPGVVGITVLCGHASAAELVAIFSAGILDRR